jgi:hypothetical protein
MMAGQLALNGSKSTNTVCAQVGVCKYDIYNVRIDKSVFIRDASDNQRDTASVIKDMIAFRDSRDYSIFSLREINEMAQDLIHILA